MTDLIEQIISPRAKDLGDGFKVRRILPFHNRKMVGPFIFFDHFGPVEYTPGAGFDVRAHPHIGLATVTFLFSGAIAHKDTIGSDLVIRPGAVNWMTAGRGICHSERTPPEERAAGQTLHGIQTWVALPKEYMETAPDFVHHPAETLPEFDLGGANARVLAGTAFRHTAPVKYPHTVWYVGAEAPNGADFNIDAGEAVERALYMAEGSALIDGQTIAENELAIFKSGEDISVQIAHGSRFMLAGGDPMGERRLIDWNFVGIDKTRIEQAKADWRLSAKKGWIDTPFTLPDGETEFIPLP